MKRIPVLAVAVSVVLLVGCHEDQQPLAPTEPQSLQSSAVGPLGLIEEPRIGSYLAESGSNLEREFTFTGWVNFPPDPNPERAQLVVLVDRLGNGPSLPVPVNTGRPSNQPEMVGGQLVYPFSIGPFKPFLELVNKPGNSNADPWPNGGTAKIQILAASPTRAEQLRGRDEDGVKGRPEGPSLVFADRTIPPGTPGYLGKRGQNGTEEDTRAYYQSVYVTSDGSEAPGQTIWERLNSLDGFRARYFKTGFLSACHSPLSLKVDASPATYFNKGDLGIGREMHCSYNVCRKETACFVKNYGDQDGNPFFTTDLAPSRKAIRANKPFATVAMVSRGKMAAQDPNKVFFVVYSGNGTSLLLKAELDNVKHNTFIPGNCLACHGAAATFLPNDAGTREVKGAQFLPFDLRYALDFYSTTGSRSRADQEAKFKVLNRIVATTDLYALTDAKTLLNGFYGAGPGVDLDPFGLAWPSPTFKDGWAPAGWQNPSEQGRQLYRRVVAPYCRTCHISHPNPILSFGSYDLFRGFAGRIHKAACKDRDQNIMPNAEITSEAFWRSDARAQLVQRLNASFPGCGPE
jgi:hypothetical protein